MRRPRDVARAALASAAILAVLAGGLGATAPGAPWTGSDGVPRDAAAHLHAGLPLGLAPLASESARDGGLRLWPASGPSPAAPAASRRPPTGGVDPARAAVAPGEAGGRRFKRLRCFRL